MGKQYKIYMYLRLSKEDEGNEDESNSIRMQRIMLQKYVEQKFIKDDYKLLEIQDDGYSGTNFDRPGITNLLELVKEGGVDCIVIKDFSRFSRDYIELGTYIDRIFPFMGIRFISVNDKYDSNDHIGGIGDIDIPFKNLVYDLYSKDLSVKVKTALSARKEKGLYVSGNCPFGYEKSPYDRHLLMIAEDEAGIIRRIFRMTLEGKTSGQIAKQFNMEGIKTPIELKIEKGRTSRVPKGKSFIWTGSGICQIIHNEIYAGDVVYGKFYREEAGGKNHIKPKTEWKVCRNVHEPIIDRETFDKIQKRRGKQYALPGFPHPLTGYLICGGCGKNMHRRKGLNPYFCCSYLYQDPQENCVRNINVMFLEQYILYEIQQKIQELADLDEMYKKRDSGLRKRIQIEQSLKHSAQAELNLLYKEKIENYERYVMSGKKKEGTEYNEYCKDAVRISQRETQLCALLTELGSKLDELERSIDNINVAELLKYFGISQLTKENVAIFIDKIVVEDEQNIQIFWNQNILHLLDSKEGIT